MTTQYRPATTRDLPAINDIYYQHEAENDPDLPPPRPLACYPYLLANGEMWVAEENGATIGFSGVLTWGDIAYLTDLFVRSDYQSASVGKMLLRHNLPGDGMIRCTLASNDPRAVSRYVRAGMQPQWPHYWLVAEPTALAGLPVSGVEVAPADVSDPAFLQWDAELCGRRRPQDLAHWRATNRAVPVWFRRAGETIGYGLIQTYSDSSLWNPDAYTIGPIGARRVEDAVACVSAAVAWAQPRATAIRLALPGPHPALAPLLGAGFRIVYVETFCSSASVPFFDPRRYITSGEWL